MFTSTRVEGGNMVFLVGRESHSTKYKSRMKGVFDVLVHQTSPSYKCHVEEAQQCALGLPPSALPPSPLLITFLSPSVAWSTHTCDVPCVLAACLSMEVGVGSQNRPVPTL